MKHQSHSTEERTGYQFFSSFFLLILHFEAIMLYPTNINFFVLIYSLNPLNDEPYFFLMYL